MRQTLMALAALTVIGAASGGLLGLTLETGASLEPGSAQQPLALKDVTKAASEKQRSLAEQGHGVGDNGHGASDAGHKETATGQAMQVREMPPIVTNLAVPGTSWVRLQAAIVYDAKAVPNPDLLVTELTADIVAFLRSVSLASIEGADGLRGLREDLSERATIRSEGRVHEFIIQALVVQ
ncbi:MAG: flagellar basal body-associated FliL family protein [Methylocystis sp.]|nr:flagellar basal body-associated FliL family protein [Methylocystis sp.]